MEAGVMRWAGRDGGALVLELPAGAGWIEVTRVVAGGGPAWRVEARLGDQHYKLADAFPTREAAQGGGLLLAMRLAPAHRAALHGALDAVPGVWWWRIAPSGDSGAEPRSICSSRVSESAAAAERSGRAAGRGWWLHVYGPGSALALGLVPR